MKTGSAGSRPPIKPKSLFDELVPVTTLTIAGATNRRILAVEHMVSIYLALSLYARLIVDFLTRV